MKDPDVLLEVEIMMNSVYGDVLDKLKPKKKKGVDPFPGKKPVDPEALER